MSNTSEGIIVPQEETEKGYQHLLYLQTLPQISRQQFANNIQKAIGDLDDPYVPFSLKPVLNQLLAASVTYVEEGNTEHFFALCYQVIATCSQGWSYLSCWAGSEQSRCYAIFWRLKMALEKHQEQMAMFHGSQNDDEPRQVYQITFSNRQK